MSKKLIPIVDIIEEENNFLLVAELPGVSKETLDIEVEKDTLKIQGKTAWELGNWQPVRREFVDDYVFERNFSIGNAIDRNKIEAKMEDGLLYLTLGKSEESKPRKIEIQ